MENDFQYDVPLVYDPLVPACSPLAHDPMGVTGGIAPAPTYMGNLGSALNNAVNAITGLPPQYTQQSKDLLAQANNISQGAWPSVAAQRWMAAQANQSGAGQSVQSPALTIIPAAEKARAKLNKLLDQIPMRLAANIRDIDFYDRGPARFVITYTNTHTLEFENVDEFPTDTDIARIALECP